MLPASPLLSALCEVFRGYRSQLFPGTAGAGPQANWEKEERESDGR